MNDAGDGPDETGPGADATGGAAGDRGPQGEAVGSVGEEAAKLLGALSDWARDQGTDVSGSASAAASSFVDAAHEVNEHLATGSADCRYCPVCQVIHVVRSTSPEVRTHLAVAASSLMQAAAGLLATSGEGRASEPVQKIDLDDGAAWDDEQ